MAGVEIETEDVIDIETGDVTVIEIEGTGGMTGYLSHHHPSFLFFLF